MAGPSNVLAQRKLSPGVAGWALVLVVVVVMDLVAYTNDDETLSAAYARTRKHPTWRWVPVVLATYLVAHLEQRPRWAQRFDPLRSRPARRATRPDA